MFFRHIDQLIDKYIHTNHTEWDECAYILFR